MSSLISSRFTSYRRMIIFPSVFSGRTHGDLSEFCCFLVMEFEVFGQVFVSESSINCLECQHLYQPNPGEDILICLRTLKTISHEIEDVFECEGF